MEPPGTVRFRQFPRTKIKTERISNSLSEGICKNEKSEQPRFPKQSIKVSALGIVL